MTYKLAALRFRSVGERSARFQDLTLTFTAPADGGSEPQDSVIWLRNGGGKSSILSLLYALLLPRAADFMGRSVNRSLTDYIDFGDTALVQFANGDQDLAGGKLDRRVGTQLAAARIVGLDLRGADHPSSVTAFTSPWRYRAARVICARETCSRFSWSAVTAG